MKLFLFIGLFVSFSHVYAQSAKPNNGHAFIKGRYIMEHASCAGFDFIDNKIVVWYSEFQCNYPDTLRLKWINENTFIVRDKTRLNKISPPRVYVYQIIKDDGKQLILKSIWTGWNDLKDTILVFNKE
jgi:hypothetical protein